MSVIPVPQDVIELIIHVLIDENSPTSREALRACTFITPALVSQIQRHLFADISLDSKLSCARLSSVLINHPDLAAYVKRLNILLAYSTRPAQAQEPGHLMSIILLVSNLESLHLDSMSGEPESFSDLPDPVESAFRIRCRTVVDLQCRGVHNLPMRLIAACKQLRRLEIRTPQDPLRRDLRQTFTDTPPLPFDTVDTAVHQLEELIIDHGSYLPIFDTPPPLIKSLSSHNVPTRIVVELLHGSRASLVRFDIKTKYFHPAHAQFDLPVDFPALEEFSISQMMWPGSNISEMACRTFLGVLTMLEDGSDASHRKLRAVKLNFILEDPVSMAYFIPLDLWGRLDAALAHPRYKLFTGLTIQIAFLEGALRQREIVRGNILHWLPGLVGTSKVTITMNDYWFY